VSRLVQNQVDRHWSVIAAILRRVDQEHLYDGYGFPSTIHWAEAELGLDALEATRYLQAGDLMAQALEVPSETWRQLSWGKLGLIRRVVNLGADLPTWVTRATDAPSVEALRGQVAHYLDPESEVFARFGFRAPQQSIVTYEAAMVLALTDATGDPTTPAERIHHPDVAFRCWDVIVAHYVSLAVLPGSSEIG
jgi:hypothetical protein